MVSILVMSVVDRRFEAQSDQTEDYKMVFVALYTALRSKKKD